MRVPDSGRAPDCLGPAEPTLSWNFEQSLDRIDASPLRRRALRTLQLNIGLRCNLACHHCHVESGPKRREALDRAGAERILDVLAASPGIETLDLTGGAPELHPEFRFLVAGARESGKHVVDRCNLTVLFEPGQSDTAAFLARHQVEIIASLPCYTPENVEAQRGRGVFDGSIRALLELNELGYGMPDSPLRLRLVYNPVDASLPGAQGELESRYRAELRRLFGIEFHDLLTITNMPIKRFARELEREGRMADYMQLLVAHFNPENVPGLMCRDTLSVAWDGRLYDCDFNQALDLPTRGPAPDIFALDRASRFEGAPIATGPHCFGCTAGAGSSCGGALQAKQ